MGNNRLFSFRTDFKGERKEYLGIRVTPAPVSSVSQPFTAAGANPVKVLADVESQPIRVEVHDKGDQENPKEVTDFYLESNSSEFTKLNMGTHWLIIRSSWLFSGRPALAYRLPEKLNKWPVRLLLLPVELIWRVIIFPVQLAIVTYRLLCGPGEVNITVGGPEG